MRDARRSSGGLAWLLQLSGELRAFYETDRNCPHAYEPSGEDFVSPCLAEADVMRRVLPPKAYAKWLSIFIPKMTLKPAVVTDPSVTGEHYEGDHWLGSFATYLVTRRGVR